MDILNTIKQIASFADQTVRKTGAAHWSTVHFRKGEVFAQNPYGGACAPIELKLDCGVSAPCLLKALRAIGGEPSFSLSKGSLTVQHGDTKAILPTSSNKNAPKLHRPNGVAWKACVDLAQAGRVSWAASVDETRMQLCGVWLGKNGIEATNGFALARLGGVDFEEILKGKGCNVPVSMLRNIAKESWIARDGNRLYIANDEHGKEFRSCNLISEAFPSTSQVIGDLNASPAILINRNQFLDLLKRAKLSTTMFVISLLENHLSLHADEAQTATLFRFMDSIPLENTGVELPADLRIGIDLRYLLPLVDNCTSDVVSLRISDPLDPLVVQDGRYVGVVMPYRL